MMTDKTTPTTPELDAMIAAAEATRPNIIDTNDADYRAMRDRVPTPAAKPATLKYETKTCGRCGGSGSYSYNTMHGSVCYGCSGRKTVASAAGARARKAVDAFIAEHFSVVAGDVKAGDVVRYDGRARTVKSVKRSGTYGTSTTTVNGETVTVRHEYLDIEFTKPIASQFGAFSSVGMPTTTMLVRGVSGAKWVRVVEFARTIKRGVTVIE